MNWSKRVWLVAVPVLCALLAVQVASARNPALEKREAMMAMKAGPSSGNGHLEELPAARDTTTSA